MKCDGEEAGADSKASSSKKVKNTGSWVFIPHES